MPLLEFEVMNCPVVLVCSDMGGVRRKFSKLLAGVVVEEVEPFLGFLSLDKNENKPRIFYCSSLEAKGRNPGRKLVVTSLGEFMSILGGGGWYYKSTRELLRIKRMLEILSSMK